MLISYWSSDVCSSDLALPVALSGQAAIAAVRPPALPQCQGEVDPAQDDVGTGGVLLGAARGQDDHPLRASDQGGPVAALRGRHAPAPFAALGPPVRARLPARGGAP